MKIAYLFPGQGSQSIGMLAEFQELGNEVQEHLTRASETIGIDLLSIITHGPEEQLNQTEITQPAILAASIGLYSMAQRFGLDLPCAVAGHSLGEYSALVASGILSFETSVQLVHERGKIMQSTVPKGTGSMAAVVGLSDATVQHICDTIAGSVEIANYNSPGQVVIAGLTTDVQRASLACSDNGARRVVPIDMSVPSHCSLLHSAQKQLNEVISQLEFQRPSFKVYQNVNAKVAHSPEEVKQNLVQQISSSVLWHQSIHAMIGQGVDTFIECGPGRVLTGLMRRIDREVTAMTLSNRATFEQLVRERI